MWKTWREEHSVTLKTIDETLVHSSLHMKGAQMLKILHSLLSLFGGADEVFQLVQVLLELVPRKGKQLLVFSPLIWQHSLTNSSCRGAVAYRGGEFGGFKLPPPEIPKAHQNRAKPNPIVKTVKNC